MPDINFDCPKCGHNLSVDENGAGMTVPCPECSQPIQIPLPKTSPPNIKSFACPHCKHLVKYNLESIGQLIDCPSCKKTIEVGTSKQNPPPSSLLQGAAGVKHSFTPNQHTSEKNKLTPPAAPASSTFVGISYNQGKVIILLLLVASGFLPFLGMFRPAEKWEYTIESPSDSSLEYALERLGNGGWELVAARRATSDYGGPSYEMIFKRPKRLF